MEGAPGRSQRPTKVSTRATGSDVVIDAVLIFCDEESHGTKGLNKIETMVRHADGWRGAGAATKRTRKAERERADHLGLRTVGDGPSRERSWKNETRADDSRGYVKHEWRCRLCGLTAKSAKQDTVNVIFDGLAAAGFERIELSHLAAYT